MCEHLEALDNELKAMGLKETFRGQAWGDSTREWVYYDCVFDLENIQRRYNLPPFVTIHLNDDIKSGMEAGFSCDQCKDGVMGHHPHFGNGKRLVS